MKTSFRKHFWGALATAAALCSFAEPAAAHGGFARAFGVITEPGNPDHTILRSDVWGFFRSVDGGATWQWYCAETYGAISTTADHRNIAIAPGGRVFVASSFAGLRMTDDGCEWTSSSTFEDELVADVAVVGNDVLVLTSTGSATGITGAVWRSTDGGDTWAKVGAALPTDFAASSFAFPDATRVYVSGGVVGAGDAIERSDDGGATWTRFPIPTDLTGATIRIHGTVPHWPDVLFVWADLSETLNQDSVDEIWVTPDAGETWSLAYRGTGDLPGFTFSPDGSNVVIAGPLEGVLSAVVGEVIASGPAAFQQTFDGPIWGLSWTDAALFAGYNDFAAAGIPKFTFGKSEDEGKTFSPIMDICQVEFPTCAATSITERACRRVLEMPGGFDQDMLSSARCVDPEPPSADAGTTPPKDKPGSGDGGCGCSAPGRAGTADALLLALAAVAGGAIRRRRRW